MLFSASWLQTQQDSVRKRFKGFAVKCFAHILHDVTDKVFGFWLFLFVLELFLFLDLYCDLLLNEEVFMFVSW